MSLYLISSLVICGLVTSTSSVNLVQPGSPHVSESRRTQWGRWNLDLSGAFTNDLNHDEIFNNVRGVLITTSTNVFSVDYLQGFARAYDDALLQFYGADVERSQHFYTNLQNELSKVFDGIIGDMVNETKHALLELDIPNIDSMLQQLTCDLQENAQRHIKFLCLGDPKKKPEQSTCEHDDDAEMNQDNQPELLSFEDDDDAGMEQFSYDDDVNDAEMDEISISLLDLVASDAENVEDTTDVEKEEDASVTFRSELDVILVDWKERSPLPSVIGDRRHLRIATATSTDGSLDSSSSGGPWSTDDGCTSEPSSTASCSAHEASQAILTDSPDHIVGPSTGQTKGLDMLQADNNNDDSEHDRKLVEICHSSSAETDTATSVPTRSTIKSTSERPVSQFSRLTSNKRKRKPTRSPINLDVVYHDGELSSESGHYEVGPSNVSASTDPAPPVTDPKSAAAQSDSDNSILPVSEHISPAVPSNPDNSDPPVSEPKSPSVPDSSAPPVSEHRSLPVPSNPDTSAPSVSESKSPAVSSISDSLIPPIFKLQPVAVPSDSGTPLPQVSGTKSPTVPSSSGNAVPPESESKPAAASPDYVDSVSPIPGPESATCEASEGSLNVVKDVILKSFDCLSHLLRDTADLQSETDLADLIYSTMKEFTVEILNGVVIPHLQYETLSRCVQLRAIKRHITLLHDSGKPLPSLLQAQQQIDTIANVDSLLKHFQTLWKLLHAPLSQTVHKSLVKTKMEHVLATNRHVLTIMHFLSGNKWTRDHQTNALGTLQNERRSTLVDLESLPYDWAIANLPNFESWFDEWQCHIDAHEGPLVDLTAALVDGLPELLPPDDFSQIGNHLPPDIVNHVDGIEHIVETFRQKVIRAVDEIRQSALEALYSYLTSLSASNHSNEFLPVLDVLRARNILRKFCYKKAFLVMSQLHLQLDMLLSARSDKFSSLSGPEFDSTWEQLSQSLRQMFHKNVMFTLLQARESCQLIDTKTLDYLQCLNE